MGPIWGLWGGERKGIQRMFAKRDGVIRLGLLAALLTAALSAKPSITTTSLPNGVTGVSYSAALSASGSPSGTWSIIAGALPAGLTLSSTGAISGTPTAVGTANFTVQITDGTGSDSRALQIAVASGLSIGSTSLPPAQVCAVLTGVPPRPASSVT